MKTVQLVEGGHLFYAADYDEKVVSEWVLEGGFHNGPGCVLCLDAWCHHCQPDRETEPCPELEEPGLFDLTDYSDTYLAWRTSAD